MREMHLLVYKSMGNVISIVYSSGGGNTRLVVEQVRDVLASHDIAVNLINAIVATPEDLTKSDVMLLAAPTYDHGILHAPFEKLLFAATETDLSNHTYAVIGLGDEKYDHEYTVEAATLLETFVLQHNGSLLCESLRINKNPVDRLETVVTDRAGNLAVALKKHYR